MLYIQDLSLATTQDASFLVHPSQPCASYLQGIKEYEPRVVHQLLDFMYRNVAEVLQVAEASTASDIPDDVLESLLYARPGTSILAMYTILGFVPWSACLLACACTTCKFVDCANLYMSQFMN